RRAARALAGEATGAALLEAAGYQLLDTQARLTWTVRCDDEPVEVELRCDALVGRDGRRLVAEVKTGDRAPSLATAATRRQLLEYVVAYRADGVLLVDPEAGAIHEVDFDLARDAPPAPPPPSSIRSRVGWFAAGVVAGAIAAVAAVAPW
ncbi:MAG: hypothetical protein KC464_01210, partial [Myxococcales bacterium]|nr:hypothetical protein [Myxococcales bacterium]